jgi:DNA-binding NarL/FixJ family response regulator
MAREHRPEVLLLDVNFEGYDRDGFAVCRELTADRETRSIRVVLFTANDDPENRAFASAVGATAFIVKPFGPLDLVRLLRVIREQSGDEPRVGLRLIESGLITPSQLEEALADQRRRAEKIPLGNILVQLGFAKQEDVQRALAREQRSPLQSGTSARSRTTLRVVIADDNASVREGLREVITAEADLVLVGVAADGAEALRLITTQKPDLAVLDNDMPQRTGLEVLRTVHETMPDTAIVMFTLDDSIRDAALSAGAAAVLPKDTPIDTLLAEMRRHARPSPEAKVPKSVVLTRHGVGAAWRTMAQRRRAVTVIAILLVAYVGAFLLGEPTFGASASLLAIPLVALGGALLGPEGGIALALLSSIASIALWQSTDHQIGEPILRIGGNGLGILALVSVGAGFGAMRLVRGRLDTRARRVGALAEAALALTAGLDPTTLAMLAEAVLELVPGDAALIYVAVPGGGLELVAAAGVDKSVLGQRRPDGAIANSFRDAQVTPLTAHDGMAMEDLANARSGVAVPLSRPGEPPCGVLAVFDNRTVAYGPDQIQSVMSYGSFLAALLRVSPAATAVDEGLPARP